MPDAEAIIYLAKAEECLAGAKSELAGGRFNNTANRGYYASFHAAIAALIDEGIRPASSRRLWEHEFVQARSIGQLINRAKVYPLVIRRTLNDLQSVRHRADYGRENITSEEARLVYERARAFVAFVKTHIEESP